MFIITQFSNLYTCYRELVPFDNVELVPGQSAQTSFFEGREDTDFRCALQSICIGCIIGFFLKRFFSKSVLRPFNRMVNGAHVHIPTLTFFGPLNQ